MTFSGLFTTLHGDCEDRVEVVLSAENLNRGKRRTQKVNHLNLKLPLLLLLILNSQLSGPIGSIKKGHCKIKEVSFSIKSILKKHKLERNLPKHT